MKIVHFPGSFLPQIGGAEIVVHNLALQQHQAGHHVTIISSYKNWKTVNADLPYKVLPLFPKSLSLVLRAKKNNIDLRGLLTLQLIFYQTLYKFDIWHIHMVYPTGFVALPALKYLQIPSIMTSQGADIQKLSEVNYGSRLDSKIEEIIRQTLPQFDRVIAISEGIKKEFLLLGVPAEKIVKIPNGDVVSRIKTLKVNQIALRNKLNWPLKKCILLTVGRNHPKKGYIYIPEIIQKIVKIRTDFRWVIVGRETEPIVEKAKELGVDQYLQTISQISPQKNTPLQEKFLFPTDEFLELFKGADLFVFPTLLEGLPGVLIDAAAAGLPIISTNTVGCPDIVEDGFNGLLSPVKDTSGMAANILRVLDSPALRKTMGANSLKKSVEFEWETIQERYQILYQELISMANSRG